MKHTRNEKGFNCCFASTFSELRDGQEKKFLFLSFLFFVVVVLSPPFFASPSNSGAEEDDIKHFMCGVSVCVREFYISVHLQSKRRNAKRGGTFKKVSPESIQKLEEEKTN